MNASRVLQSVKLFGSRWGLPVLLGTTVGMFDIVATMDALALHLGSIIGGLLASLSGIGLGLLTAVFVALLQRLTIGHAVPKPTCITCETLL